MIVGFGGGAGDIGRNEIRFFYERYRSLIGNRVVLVDDWIRGR